MGRYSLSLLSCRKDNWIHTGSSPVRPAIMFSLDHLLKGTVRDNIRDMDSRGRRYKTMTRATIQRTKQLLQSKLLLHTEIAQIVGIDVRRVSDINCDRYNDDATIKRKR